MASLIVAGSLLLHNKIKDKKDAKREKKRQSYQDRYDELQREHSQHQEKYIQKETTGGSQSRSSRDNIMESEKTHHRNASQNSLKSTDSGDGPAQWVDEVAKTRHKN